MRLTLFLIFFLSVVAKANVNQVPLAPGHFHLGFIETYFQSQENFTSKGGSFENLANGGNFQEWTSQFLLDYDVNANWRLRSDFDFDFVQTKNSLYSKENSHLRRLGVGAEYWKSLKNTPFVPYFHLSTPLYKPDLNEAVAFGTDGALQAELGLFVRPRFGSLLGKLDVAYAWRNENLSHLLPWSLGASYSLGVGEVGGGLRGFQTFTKDSSSSSTQSQRSTAIQNAQAGSLKYLSTDPQVQKLYVESRWGLLKGLDLATDLSYDFNGQNYAKGFAVSIGVYWVTDFKRLAPSKANPSSERDFEAQKEKYREKLFRQAHPDKKPRQIKRKKPNQKSMEQLLDEAERDLEP